MSVLKPLSKEDTQTVLLEMFRRVGLTEDDYRHFDFSEPNWYEQHVWAQEEQADFRKWLGKFLTDKKYVGKTKYRDQDWGEYEAGKFILCYGWRATYSDDRKPQGY